MLGKTTLRLCGFAAASPKHGPLRQSCSCSSPEFPFARRVPHASSHSPKTCWLGQLETQSACRCECVCQITCMLAEHAHEEKVGMFFACSQHSKESELNRIMWLPYLTTFEWCHSLCRINMFLYSMLVKQHFQLIQVSAFYRCIRAVFRWSTIYAAMV